MSGKTGEPGDLDGLIDKWPGLGLLILLEELRDRLSLVLHCISFSIVDRARASAAPYKS